MDTLILQEISRKLDEVKQLLSAQAENVDLIKTILQSIDFHAITVFTAVCAVCLLINSFIKKGWLF